MNKDEIVDKLSELGSKISCMAHFKSDISEDVDYGFYLVMTGISEDLGILSVDVDKLGDDCCKNLSELFPVKK